MFYEVFFFFLNEQGHCFGKERFNHFFFNAVRTSNEISFSSIVLGWLLKSQMDISKLGQIKPKLSALEDTACGE